MSSDPNLTGAPMLHTQSCEHRPLQLHKPNKMQQWRDWGLDGGGGAVFSLINHSYWNQSWGGGDWGAVVVGDASCFAMGRNSFFFFFFLWRLLIFHVGTTHSFMRRRDRGVYGASATLLRYSLKGGNIGPRCRILTPAPPPMTPPSPPPPLLPGNDVCSTGFHFLLIIQAWS